MSNDKSRIHRWMTQEDLERMLEDAYREGASQTASEVEQLRREAAAALGEGHGAGYGAGYRAGKAEATAAYQRGAEAMREQLCFAVPSLATVFRGFPIPKDEQ